MKKYFSIVLLFIILMTLFSGSCGKKPTSKNVNLKIAKELNLLDKETVIKEIISGKEIHHYKITLQGKQFSEIKLNAENIDLSMQILDKNNKELISINNLTGLFAEENTAVFSHNNEPYTIQVSSNTNSSVVGSYSLVIAKPRVALGEDEEFYNAEVVYSEARAINEEGEQLDKEKAIKKCEVALDIYSRLGNKKKEALCLRHIGLLYSKSANYDKAIEYYKKALEGFRQISLLEGEGEALNAIGLAYFDQGRNNDALEYYKIALPLIEKAQDREMQANVLNNIGSVLWSTGQLESAIDYYNQVSKIHKELNNQEGLSIAFHNIGSVYDEMGDYQEACRLYEKALEIEKSIDDKLGEAFTLVMLGRSQNSLGETERAIETYQQVIKKIDSVGNNNVKSIALNELANSYTRLQQIDKAMEYYNLATPLTKVTGNKKGQAISLIGMGKVLLSQKKYVEASEKLLEGLALIRSVIDISVEMDALYGLAKLEEQRGDLKKSLEYIKTCLDILESVRARLYTFKSRTAYFASVHDYYDLYINLLMQLKKDNPKNEELAFQASENAHARVLAESLVESIAKLKNNIDKKLVDKEKTNIDLLDSKIQSKIQLASKNAAAIEIKKLDKEIDSIRNNLEEIEREIRKTNPQYIGLKSTDKINIKQIQATLDKDTVLVEYFLGNTDSYVWLLTRNSFTSYKLVTRNVIDKLSRTFYENIAARAIKVPFEDAGERKSRIEKADQMYSTLSKELSDVILKPFGNLLKGKRLLIVTDGSLNYVPFAALADPSESQIIPLIVSHEIAHLPSLTSLNVIREVFSSRPIPPKTIMVVSDPVFSQEDPRLVGVKTDPKLDLLASRSVDLFQRTILDIGVERSTLLPRLIFTKEESDAIKSQVEPELFLEKTGFQANEKIFNLKEIKNYKILHFATHAVINSSNPELSGLILSLFDDSGKEQPGFLSVAQIFSLNLPAELVVLSACSTGLGKEIKGEGLVGFTQAFMYAGAKRIIVTQWNINDKSTSKIISIFYRKLFLDNKPYITALREAQLELMKNNQWNSPYYWAAFVLQGEYL